MSMRIPNHAIGLTALVSAVLAILFASPTSGAEVLRASGGPAVSLGTRADDETAPVNPVTSEAFRSWPVSLTNPYGSPVFYDLDGDGRDEVIVGDHNRAYVFEGDGTIRPGWPRSTGPIDHHPAIGDIDGDGAPEIAFGIRTQPPKLYVFDSGGATEPGWPVSLPFARWLNVSGPVIADINLDGHLDVGIASELGVSFFDYRGVPLPGWPYLWAAPTQNIQWSCPAVADIDLGDSPEVVVGNASFMCESVHVIQADGTALPGWPISTQSIFSSPALADLDGDGDLEIIVQEGDYTWNGRNLYVWHHDGTPLAGWPVAIAADWEGSRSNPSVADIDQDGALEIITLSGDGRLHILRADGSYFPGYPKQTIAVEPISSTSIVDVDGDWIEEIFFTYWRASNQYVGGWRLDGTMLPGFPKLLFANTDLNAHGSAHVADFDHDGDLDVTACGTSLSGGSLCVFEVDQSVYNPHWTRCDWPKIRHDIPNTGCFMRRDPARVEGQEGARIVNFAIAPNPAVRASRLTLRTPNGWSGSLAVLDATGRLVWRRLDLSGSTPGAVPVSELFGTPSPASGVYLVRWQPTIGKPTATRLVWIAN